jgi:tRNA modification GTPase
MRSPSDTIVAIATPAGQGAIGIVRLSGKEAIAIADKVFRGKRLAEQQSHTVHFGKIIDGNTVIDEAVASIFIAPKSYTGENTVEFSCHGSDYVLQKVVQLTTEQGARLAQAGEFTQRAFLNGKLDLVQAEAVADLIASQSQSAHKAAIHHLRGGFSQTLHHMREQLLQFSALIELELDFSEEDVEFADRRQFTDLTERIAATVDELIQSFRLGNVIKNGVKVAIVGKPNAGKSTLLNSLVNEERAIVSEIAGTTRDTIEETLQIKGILFRLTDTAGIRNHTADRIEAQGIARSKVAMQQADVIIYLFDIAATEPEELKAQLEMLATFHVPVLPVGNKADLLPAPHVAERLADAAPHLIFIAAKEQQNIEVLKERLYQLMSAGIAQPEATILTNARHLAALEALASALSDITCGIAARTPGDLLSLDIRRALHYIGELTGAVTTEDKLDYIFSKFCIGK